MPFATHADIKIFWCETGDRKNPPLLLLNAIGTDIGVWDRVVPLLRPSFHILRMDMRGHGRSDVPPGDYTLEQLAGDACAVLDAANVEKAAVCGLSLGGMVAMTLALDHAERVEAMILACTSVSMDREDWDARITRVRSAGMPIITEMALDRFFAEGFKHAHPDVVEPIRAGLLATDRIGYTGCAAAIRDMRLEARLGTIQAPTLVIAGSKDVSTPFQGHGDAIVAGIPGAGMISLRAAHLASLEDPAGMAGAIHGFLTDPALKEARARLYDSGIVHRRNVLGDAWVDKSLAARTPFNAEFQAMITRIAWQEVWSRPGLDHRTRRLIVIAIMATLGRWEEFKLHIRAGIEQYAFTESELKETLMETAIYAGIPAANTAFAEAATILREIDKAASS